MRLRRPLLPISLSLIVCLWRLLHLRWNVSLTLWRPVIPVSLRLVVRFLRLLHLWRNVNLSLWCPVTPVRLRLIIWLLHLRLRVPLCHVHLLGWLLLLLPLLGPCFV